MPPSSSPSSTQHSVQCLSPAGLHRMAYTEWGDPQNKNILICVHGLTRVASDFDQLAQALSPHYRVICPDIAGRGKSDWLRDPMQYQVPQYVSDCVTLIARLNTNTVHWFGTSMGGLIGLCLAALPNSPIRKLILNDVGASLDAAALTRIGEYLGKKPVFQTLEAGIQYVRQVSATFGAQTEEEWKKIATDVFVPTPEGAWTLHYDPAIAIAFKATTKEQWQANEALLWQAYAAIQCPTLLIRGAQSDLLSRETAQRMTMCGPKARLVELPGIGHAPMFLHADQIALARDFLLGPD